MRCSPAWKPARHRPCASPRDEALESLNVRGLVPAGEGAGYAGGILSAGIDGIRAAEALARQILSAEPKPD